jgi:hypothetical protein
MTKQLFSTITGVDWLLAFERAKTEANPLEAQIARKVLELNANSYFATETQHQQERIVAQATDDIRRLVKQEHDRTYNPRTRQPDPSGADNAS